MEAHINRLINKAANAEKSEDAMRFSQAAVNSANALSALIYVKQQKALAGTAPRADEDSDIPS